MRRMWNSWTYYGKGESGRKDGDSICQESWRTVDETEGAQESANSKSTLESAYERSLTRSVAGALERAMDLSDVRNERVARVKQAIESGSYRVSARELAERLIRNMRGYYR